MTSPGDSRCPVCRTSLWSPATDTMGSLRCPRCEAELWAFASRRGPMVFVRRPGESALDFLASLTATRYGTTAEEMMETISGMDELDLVELIVELVG